MRNKILEISSIGGLIAIPFFVVACKNNLTFSIEYKKTNKSEKFFNDILNKYNELKDANSFEKEKLTYFKKYVGNYRTHNYDIAQDIVKGTSTLGLLRVANYIEKKDELKAILQSQTTAFNFDEENNSKYSDGTNNDALVKIAKKAYAQFSETEYDKWTDNKYKWDKDQYRYNYFYNLTKRVDHYRGNVMIWGNDEEIKRIRAAWNNKDWEVFRDFGIMTGKPNSASKYLLQEALFKKHFGSKFKSFSLDKLKNEDKYTVGNAKEIGQGSNANYHIVFDELGSFAYTRNVDEQGKRNNFYKPKWGHIEFLTVTESAKYNIWAVNKNLNEKTTKLLTDAIYKLWEEGKDIFGPTIGINGYKKINNIQDEVVNPYEGLFG